MKFVETGNETLKRIEPSVITENIGAYEVNIIGSVEQLHHAI